MPKGKAQGVDRDYQVVCRMLIQEVQQQNELVPYAGDGIDIPIPISGTTVTFDVALKTPEGNLIVAECKRWKSRVKQDYLFGFSKKVDELRKELGVEVAGIFVAKRGFQRGARGAALSPRGLAIEIATYEHDQLVSDFAVMFERYDPQREATTRRGLAHMSGTMPPPHGNLTVQVRQVGRAP